MRIKEFSRRSFSTSSPTTIVGSFGGLALRILVKELDPTS
jgi:hypothetical protein